MATLALAVAGQVVGGAIGGPIGATIGRALGALAGSAIDGALFGEKPPAVSHSDIRLQGSAEGGAIPRLYGWSRLAGNIIWATELEQLTGESRGAKGTSSQDGDADEIAASFAVAFCEGEVARLGRIWADGQLLDPQGVTYRFHRGTETQDADSLIAAVQGEAPAYRGLCYMVFERLPLSGFGNRIPNVSVELCRVVGELEPAIRAVTIIPGATEFGYDPAPRVRVLGRGATDNENAHLLPGISDWTLSIDELCDLCPNLERVALVVAWFGDDLRAGHCTIRPKVEAHAREVDGVSWSVAGLSRGAAEVVSSHDGGPAYGGTPSDAAVRAAIADLHHRGLEVTLYPLILMDIAEDNGLGQPAYPWRGRIGGQPGADGTAAADAQVAAFVGSGAGWDFTRFVMHYANMARETGCEGFILGSEMRGLTTLRGAGGGFPFVEALLGLADDVRDVLGPGPGLTYAADWSEYHGYQPADAPGDKLFHLDPLWASDAISAVGIDNYMPAADWRDGEDHVDWADWDGPHELGYLEANIAGGEGFDWYYADDSGRLAGVRTPISDGGYGEPWVWRFKDLEGWWSHAHHDRVGGVRAADPTGWVASSKPIWFTELGCGAVDKGANQPNKFADEKSAESGRPWFSTGMPDPLGQRQFLRAQLRHWAGEANPLSPVYHAPMVDPGRVFLWTWDARPFPVFPNAGETWRDAANHATGHWLTGRLGAMASDELVAAVAEDYGADFAVTAAAGPLITGLLVENVASARDVLEPVLTATGLSVREHAGGLAVDRPRLRDAVAIDPDQLVNADAPLLSRRRPDPAEAVGQLALGYRDRSRDYLAATVSAMRLDGGVAAGLASGLSLDPGSARLAAERGLIALAASGETVELTLPPSALAFEAGDVLALDGLADGPFEITELRDGAARKISARAVPPLLNAAIVAAQPPAIGGGAVPSALPLVVAAQLPPDAGDPATSRLLLAATASPWPGEVEVADAATGSRLVRLGRAASIGELLDPLHPGVPELWDNASLRIALYGGHVATIADETTPAGGNRLAVETDDGGWEVLGFAEAELLSAGTYRLRRLLRGQWGTDPVTGPAAVGNRVVLLDDRVALLPVPAARLGSTLALTAYAGRRDVTGTGLSVPLGIEPLLPLPPVHLVARRGSGGDVALSWIRRSRGDADGWALAEVPLEVVPEGYRVTVLDGADPVRSLDVAAPAFTYAAAEQIADFGSLPAGFDFSVAQLSPTLGPGFPAGGRFDA